MIDTGELATLIYNSTAYRDTDWHRPFSRPEWLISLISRLRVFIGEEAVVYVSSNLGWEDDPDKLKVNRLVLFTATTMVTAQVDFANGWESAAVDVTGFGRRALKEFGIEEAVFDVENQAPSRLLVRLEYGHDQRVVLPVGRAFVAGAIDGLVALTDSLKADLNSH
jgi:hypothetical protein